MPTYCYQEGETGESTNEIAIDRPRVFQRGGEISAAIRPSAAFANEGLAADVLRLHHPVRQVVARVPERAGVPTEVTPDGDPAYDAGTAAVRWKARGMVDVELYLRRTL